MRLKRTKIAGFRGFNEEQEVELDSDLVVISGDNHTGKTSLVEALEWLLFGYACRCRRGKEAYSAREYKGTYRNVHYPAEATVYVKLEAWREGCAVTLRRELIGKEDSQAYLDGQLVDDFTSLGFSLTASHPIITQHGLRDFIYTNPKSRREILSYILGLESLIKLQGDIQDAHTEYTRRRPSVCEVYDGLIPEARERGILNSVLNQLKLDSLEIAHISLLEEIREIIDVPELSEERVLAKLSEVKAKKQASILNISAYEISDDFEVESKMVKRNIENLTRRFPLVVDRLAEFIRAFSLCLEETRQLRFIKLGLKLIAESHPEICPFCKHETLTEEQIDSYNKMVEGFEDPKQISERIEKRLDRLSSEWHDIFEKVRNVAPKLPEEEDLKQITRLLAGREELIRYENTRIEVVRQRASWNTLAEEGEKQLELAKQRLTERKYDGALFERLGKLPQQLGGLASTLFENEIIYREQFYAIKPILEASISSTEEVKIIDLLERFWQKWPEIVKAVRYQELESNLGDLEREMRTFIAQKQKERLKQKEEEIKSWYGLLDQDEDIKFSGIRVSKTALDLLAESFGKGMKAAPCFSQSQINCLGLGVYLTQATSVGDVGFVVLDDPVQSMDESHSERLKIDVMDRLLETGHQVILLSHLYNFADDLALTHGHHFPYCIEFASYSQVGPKIEARPPRLHNYLDQANEYRTGNAERRRHSAKCLREAMERTIKRLYLQATEKRSIPRECRQASFPILKRDLLPKCTQLSPKEVNGIAATYNFVVAHPHDDMEIEPPTSEQLQPHISRLVQLCNRHGLLKTDTS